MNIRLPWFSNRTILMTYYFYSYALMIQPVASVSAQASLCRLGLPGCALVLGAWHPTGYCGYWDWPPCRQQQRAAGGRRSGVWWLRIIPAEPVLFGLQPFARETAVLVGGYKSDVLTYGKWWSEMMYVFQKRWNHQPGLPGLLFLSRPKGMIGE